MRRAPAADAQRLLVVDDDTHTRNLLRDLCEASGFLVALAEDGEAALALLAGGGVDLVLLDLMLPRRDGFEVLRDIRALPGGRDLPVILLTAMGDMDGKIRGMELGADDYVTKPFKLVELQTRIHCALQVREFRQRLAAAEEELAQLRALDPLTGAGTYSQLKASLDSELSRARRYGRNLSVLLFGFDDYTTLRYQRGREATDAYIASFARLVQRELRGADRLFRMEVDEFIALLPETDLTGAHLAAQRLDRLVGQLPVSSPEEPPAMRVRIAGASFPSPGVHSAEDLLREVNRVYAALCQAGPEARVFAA